MPRTRQQTKASATSLLSLAVETRHQIFTHLLEDVHTITFLPPREDKQTPKSRASIPLRSEFSLFFVSKQLRHEYLASLPYDRLTFNISPGLCQHDQLKDGAYYLTSYNSKTCSPDYTCPQLSNHFTPSPLVLSQLTKISLPVALYTCFHLECLYQASGELALAALRKIVLYHTIDISQYKHRKHPIYTGQDYGWMSFYNWLWNSQPIFHDPDAFPKTIEYFILTKRFYRIGGPWIRTHPEMSPHPPMPVNVWLTRKMVNPQEVAGWVLLEYMRRDETASEGRSVEAIRAV